MKSAILRALGLLLVVATTSIAVFAFDAESSHVASTSTVTTTTTVTAPGSATNTAPKPTIVSSYIPMGSKRLADMQAYSKRHYGIDSYLLTDPQLIVMHFTANNSVSATLNTFRPNRPDVSFAELPGLCAHFVIGKNGKIYQLVSLKLMCRHVVGLNHTAIGIEHVGNSDSEVLNNPKQLKASAALVEWLRCRNNLARTRVIGHSQSLKSKFFIDNVQAFKGQTHGDFKAASVGKFRRKLATKNCPS